MDVVVLILLLCGAAARVTRLLVADTFPPVAAAREAVLARWPDDTWQGYLATCPWCLAVWVAALATAGADRYYSVPAPILVWPTVAWVAGWLVGSEDHEPELDDEPEA